MNNVFLIINYNDYQSTKHLIDNIINYKIVDEIVIVDNCSNDNSYMQLEKVKGITLLKSDGNNGYSSAINYGSKYIIDKYKKANIIVSNADIIINKEKDLVKLLTDLNNKNVGIVSPVISEHGELNRGWKLPSPMMDVLMNLPVLHRYFYKKYLLYKPNRYESRLTEVEVMSGCFFLINSDILKEINYLDENVFLYYEENIIGSKLKQINKSIVIDNEIEIIHNHSVSIDKNLNKIKKYKQLKKSQYYFQTEYNKANILEIVCLLITNKITLFILYIVYFIKEKL